VGEASLGPVDPGQAKIRGEVDNSGLFPRPGVGMKSLFSIIALAFAMSSAAAFAGEEKMDHGNMDHGKMMDGCKMHGGEMSAAEHQKKMDEHFASMDLNRDGMLSKDEFAKHHEAKRSEHMDHEEKKATEDHSAHDHG